jgi:hypothetical protein
MAIKGLLTTVESRCKSCAPSDLSAGLMFVRLRFEQTHVLHVFIRWVHRQRSKSKQRLRSSRVDHQQKRVLTFKVFQEILEGHMIRRFTVAPSIFRAIFSHKKKAPSFVQGAFSWGLQL